MQRNFYLTKYYVQSTKNHKFGNKITRNFKAIYTSDKKRRNIPNVGDRNLSRTVR